MNRKLVTLLITTLLLVSLTTAAAAQEEQPGLTIGLARNFGYGGFGNKIQGNFTIRVSGPEDLVEVLFYLDDELLGSDTESPYRLQFNTDNFEPGIHRIYAVGILADGSEIQSRQLVQEFLTAGQTYIFVAVILVVVLLFTVVPALRNKKGSARPIGEYGPAGGTVCPRCQFPYSRRVVSPNLIFGKLERCPHCGKWSIRGRASNEALTAAEARLRAAQQETTQIEVNEDDSLKRALDDSRFDD